MDLQGSLRAALFRAVKALITYVCLSGSKVILLTSPVLQFV